MREIDQGYFSRMETIVVVSRCGLVNVGNRPICDDVVGGRGAVGELEVAGNRKRHPESL